MSSVTPTSKKNLFSTYPATHKTANQDEPEEQEISVEEPADQKATWQPGGYTPTRASWHTLQGRVRRYLS